MKNKEGQTYHARQWVGDAAVVDPTAPKAQEWFTKHTKEWYDGKGVKFDGLWLDMYVALMLFSSLPLFFLESLCPGIL